MDDHAYIDIAYKALERAGLSVADMTPHVEHSEQDLVTVWTSDDLRPNAFDGGYQVVMTKTGTVVQCHGTHAGTIVFPSGLDWGAGTRLYEAALDAIADIGKLDGATGDAFLHACQGGQFIFGELAGSARTELLKIVQSTAYREFLLDTFADGKVARASVFRGRVEELHAMALAENKLPEWLTYDTDGIIVKGLLWKPFADVAGASPWPAKRSRVGNSIRYDLVESPIIIDVELGPKPADAPIGAGIADVADARFIVSGEGVDPTMLTQVANQLARAHAEATAEAEPGNSLREMMLVDHEYDARSTDQLVEEATRGIGRSLMALSKRVTPDSLEQFIELLGLEKNQLPMVFGTLPANHVAIMTLLVNSAGPMRKEAERLWFELSFVTRHGLISHIGVGFKPGELPLLDDEHELLATGVEVATAQLGATEWKPQVTDDGRAVIMTARHPDPDKRGIIVGPDGSWLLADGYPSHWDAWVAFRAGERTAAHKNDGPTR